MGVEHSRVVLADEDVEEDPDRWCSYTEGGQELWQIACQWVWNLRLSLGQAMQGSAVREIEWAPPKEAPPVFVAEESPPESMAPGNGLQRSDEPPGVSGPRTSPCKRTGDCAAQPGPACG
jgi:hypothetical protein